MSIESSRINQEKLDSINLHEIEQYPIITEGKTKILRKYPEDNSLAIVQSKNDITAFNKVKHDVVEGKAVFATNTTCNVFRLLESCEIPLAFKKQLDATHFLTTLCSMIPYEVIVRREAHGSFLKRNPHLKKGHVFPKLMVEFFLKTNDCTWNGISIPKDDPFIQFADNKAHLFLPDAPIYGQESFLSLEDFPLKDNMLLFEKISEIAKQTFLILEKAWQNVSGKLVDFKVEFGFDSFGNVLLSDVIDNDSWRVVQQGNYIDKQIYRDGATLNEVTARYQQVSNLSNQFTCPRQQLIIWRGSEKDQIEPFIQFFEEYTSNINITYVTRSMHKDPVRGYQELNRLVQEIPDSVVISFIGRSNGAGPTLSANTIVPVITVPLGWGTCHEDVWSSLRSPSDTPVLTILDPKNALLAALQILSMRNPRLYAQLRTKQEKRLINYIEL